MSDTTIFKADPLISTLQRDIPALATSQIVDLETSSAPPNQAAKDLAGDMFHAIHRDLPARNPVPKQREVNAALMDWMKQSPHWNQLVENGRGNIYAAKTAAQTLYEMAQDDEVVQEATKRQEEAAQAEKAAKAAEMQAKLEPDAQDLAAIAEQLRQQAEAMHQGNNNWMNRVKQNEASQAVASRLVQKAAEEGGEVTQAMRAWGMERGSLTLTDVAEAQRFMKALTPKVKQIAKLAGRFANLAASSRRGRTEGGVIPSGVKYTKEIHRIFSREAINLSPNAPDISRIQAVRNWNRRGLMGWQTTAPREDNGDFVVMLDTSGSMSGMPETITKALALGTAQCAKAEGRTYTLASFSSHGDAILSCKSTDDWPPHLQWAEFFHGGGTCFSTAVTYAIELMRNYGDRGRNMDLLFITDGIAYLDPAIAAEWEKLAQETGARLFFVTVGIDAVGPMAEIAERTIRVDEMDLDSADELAAQVAAWMRP